MIEAPALANFRPRCSIVILGMKLKMTELLSIWICLVATLVLSESIFIIVLGFCNLWLFICIHCLLDQVLESLNFLFSL